MNIGRILTKYLHYINIYKYGDGAKLEAVSDKQNVVGICSLLLELKAQGNLSFIIINL
jgi:hypothetical protein